VIQALASAGSVGAIGGAFLLGLLYERHRHPPPPTRYEVTLVDATARQRPLDGPT